MNLLELPPQIIAYILWLVNDNRDTCTIALSKKLYKISMIAVPIGKRSIYKYNYNIAVDHLSAVLYVKGIRSEITSFNITFHDKVFLLYRRMIKLKYNAYIASCDHEIVIKSIHGRCYIDMTTQSGNVDCIIDDA